ncbi:MAG: N-acetyltransferase family protein [Actinomycetales bacterium]
MEQIRYSIRPVEQSDVPEIVAMVRELADYEQALHEAQATPEQFQAALFAEHPAVFGLVAVSDDSADSADHGGSTGSIGSLDSIGIVGIVGFALYFLNFSTWLGKHGIYLEDLYVRPQYRGSGIGQALLASLAQLCVERDYGRLEWWVLDWNEPALGFYRRLGAQPMDEWTVHRVTGTELTTLAAQAPKGGRR